jgi:hypothetical protein
MLALLGLGKHFLPAERTLHVAIARPAVGFRRELWCDLCDCNWTSNHNGGDWNPVEGDD